MSFASASSEYIDCGTSSLLDMGSGELTLMIWMRWTTSGSFGVIGKMKGGGSSDSNKYVIQTFDDGGGLDIQFKLSDGGADVDLVRSSAGFNDGEWHHAVLVRDNTANLLRGYVDGAEEGTHDITGMGSLDTPNPFLIAAGHNNGSVVIQHFDGDLDGGRLYNRALTPEEILTIYNSRGHDGIVDSLVGRWMMNEGAPGDTASGAGVIKDVGPNGLHGTPTNTPIYTDGALSYRRIVRV